MIDSLRAQYSQQELLSTFEVYRSTYRYHRQRINQVNIERERLKAKVKSIHQASRGAAGSRTIAGQLRQSGETLGVIKFGH